MIPGTKCIYTLDVTHTPNEANEGEPERLGEPAAEAREC